MRIKTDCMGNDKLLPAYNIQITVADAGYGSNNIILYCRKHGMFCAIIPFGMVFHQPNPDQPEKESAEFRVQII